VEGDGASVPDNIFACWSLYLWANYCNLEQQIVSTLTFLYKLTSSALNMALKGFLSMLLGSLELYVIVQRWAKWRSTTLDLNINLRHVMSATSFTQKKCRIERLHFFLDRWKRWGIGCDVFFYIETVEGKTHFLVYNF
jgi:hypothetical protein